VWKGCPVMTPSFVFESQDRCLRHKNVWLTCRPSIVIGKSAKNNLRQMQTSKILSDPAKKESAG
jgi:hypothetical protein